MAQPAKRQRFDLTALSPSDKAATPLATARQSLKTYAASLQPSIATILSRLGQETLVCLHKHFAKKTQARKLTDDPELIPNSARVKFTLNSSKVIEQDAEYARLAGDTATIVTKFQQDLRSKILEVTQLEEKTLLRILSETFCTHLRVAVQACLVCETALDSDQADKVIATLLSLYGARLLLPIDITVDVFREIYLRKHTLHALPSPFVTELPVPANARGQPPAQEILQILPKIFRILETIFVIPWTQYLDVVQRNKKDLELKKLNENFFTPKATDDAAMLVDAEPPADPQLLQDLVQSKVSAATTKLTKEIEKLKLTIAKNTSRDLPGASLKKKSGKRNGKNQAAGKGNGSLAEKRNSGLLPPQSNNSSAPKKPRSHRNSKK